MAKPGIIAFPVLLVLGAITGYLAYDWMVVQATPKAGVPDNSPYYKPLSQDAAAQEETPAVQVDESDFQDVVTISIPAGSSIQGATYYDPASATVAQDALIKWVNDDNVPHTATSGAGMSDADFGQLFDSSFLAAGEEYSIPASELGAGEHQYFCTVHPYMTATVTVQ
jgi:plastocyanin